MFSMLYITTGSREEAESISKRLLEQRLVACANMFPISSMYWWKGEIESAEEYAVVFKTRTELLDDAMGSIKQLHSYDVPCLVSYECFRGDKDYLNWITEETRNG